MNLFDIFVFVVGGALFTVAASFVIGPTTYVIVSTALGPTGLCPDFFPFYTESLAFYMEVGDLRPLLGIDYPGFESKEDFQACKDLYMLEHDRRLSENKLPLSTQKEIVFAAGCAATGLVVYCAYVIFTWCS